MFQRVISLFALLWLSFSSVAAIDIQPKNMFPKVELQTNMGKIVVELNRQRAPLTVDNFLTYVVKGEYDNTVFHRVINNFVVQGGGLDQDYKELKGNGTVINESGNGLSNSLGTIAMARTGNPHSAIRQFYFNVAENQKLDPSASRWGYAVFGEVIEGLDVLQAMAVKPTGTHKGLGWKDVPLEPILLEKATLIK